MEKTNITNNKNLNASEQVQKQFATHLRAPEKEPVPQGLEDRRVQIYRDLVFKNVSNFLASSFPVIKRLHDEEEWNAVMRNFLYDYRAMSPYFTRLSREFVDFLRQAEAKGEAQFFNRKPFLAQLAYYEWIETELFLSDQQTPEDDCASLYRDDASYEQLLKRLSDDEVFKQQLLACCPDFSPLARVMQFDYEVHKISVDNQPTEVNDGATFLLAHRNQANKVRFTQLNAITYRMLQLCDSKMCCTDIFDQLSKEVPGVARDALPGFGLPMLLNLAKDKVIVFSS